MEQLKKLRREFGETQETIANLVGITRGAYANIENGKREPDFHTVSVLADHFNVSIDYLLGRDEQQKNALTSEDMSALQGENMDLVLEIMKRLDRLDSDQLHKAEEYLDLLIFRQEHPDK